MPVVEVVKTLLHVAWSAGTSFSGIVEAKGAFCRAVETTTLEGADKLIEEREVATRQNPSMVISMLHQLFQCSVRDKVREARTTTKRF